MRNQTYLFSALSLGTALILTGCASDPQSTPAPTASQSAEHSGQSTHQAGTANEADMAFAAGMKMHHEQAIEMSTMLLGKPDVPQEVSELAERIKAAQSPEIERMENWLAEWDMPEGMDHSNMGHDQGMVPEDEIKALEEASGKDAAQLFLEQMIMHHEGAVEMSEAELREGDNAEAKKLAEQIIDSQSTEIDEMKQLLAGL